MKRLIWSAAVLVFVVGSAAAEAPAQKNETMSVAKAADLLSALNALSFQHDEVVGQGSTQRVIAVGYGFSADTLWAITDNVTTLRKVITTYQETVKAMQAQAEVKNGGPLTPAVAAVLDANNNLVKPEVPSADQMAVTASIQKLFDSERSIGPLVHIKRGDLCLGGPNASASCPKDTANKIAPGVISSLSPILDP